MQRQFKPQMDITVREVEVIVDFLRKKINWEQLLLLCPKAERHFK